MLPESPSATKLRPPCSPAQAQSMPTDAPLACASPAELVDQIVGSLSGGAPTTAQTQEEVRGGEWEVKHDDARSTRRRDGDGRQTSAALEKEWGGKHEVRTYYGTAAAKMIADRLGKHLTK